jgi:hypothetical protein
MKWLTILIIFQITNIFACELIKASKQDIHFEVCYYPETKTYLSKNCKKVSDCFPRDNNKANSFVPNQNPSFTLCYSLKGEPGFVTVSNSAQKKSFCRLKDNWVDLESLVISQRD